MSKWPLISLGQCCDVVSGATPKRNKPKFWGDDIRWVTPKDISKLNSTTLFETPERISEAGYQSCSARLLPRGSVLFSSRAPIGLVALAGNDMCTNQGFKSLVPGGDVDSLYLYYVMKRHAPRIADLGNGATFKEVSKETVSNYRIPLPPINEQRRIAAILDKADAIRRKRQQALTLADNFLRSTFLEMFGDPVTNPRDWEVRTLESVADINSGLTKGRKLNGRETVELPYMRVANVQDGHLDLNEIKTITLAKDEVSRFLLRAGDILLTEGGDPDKLGRGAVWKGEVDECVHQNHIFRVACNDPSVEPEFVSAQVGSARGKRYFLRSAKQTTGIATINKTQLKAFPLLIPPTGLQQRYVQIVHKVEQWKASLQQSLDQSNDLFNSLAQRAFRGEL